MKVQKYLAELLGTFLLALAIFASFAFATLVPLFIGLSLMVLVYTLGPVSGAHFNPAVTLALLTTKKIKTNEALAYILAQFVGALLAYFLLSRGFALDFSQHTVQAFKMENFHQLIGEIVGTFILLFGIYTVVSKKVVNELSGVLIGLALFMGIIIAGALGSEVFLNPAIAIASGNASWQYLIGSLIGGTLGVWTHHYLNK